MKILLNYYPNFMKRLWYQLAISYTLLTFCAMALLIVILYGIDDYNDFHAAVTLDRVQEQVGSEYPTVAQALRYADNPQWLAMARDNIRKKLTHMERGSGGTSVYRITSSSRPQVYIQITTENGHILISDPVDIPVAIANEFLLQREHPSQKISVKQPLKDGPIWVDMPIADDNDNVVGRLHIFYIAKFNIWVQLQSILDFMLYTWSYVLALSVPIGIVCALIASRYVTKQLQKMNEVTESWRQGNFEKRIALPNDDVLIRHSRYLNDMAQDLEMYLSLKQSLAISDERNRVARELHDTVKQKLFALGLQLATAKTKPTVMEAASEHILEAETITREAQHDLMEIITQLRPVETDDTSIYNRIAMIADDFSRRFDVSIELNNLEPIQCNTQTEHHVLRIVQESLMNAVRHGKASKIIITGGIDQENSTLTITDNGSGFDADQKTEGFGLISMRDRMCNISHGTFNIKSTIGVGTQITLLWRNKT